MSLLEFAAEQNFTIHRNSGSAVSVQLEVETPDGEHHAVPTGREVNNCMAGYRDTKQGQPDPQSLSQERPVGQRSARTR